VLLALANLADVFTTGWGLTRGVYETNPVAKVLMADGGLPLLLLAKMTIPVLAALLVLRAARVRPEYLGRINILLIVLTTFTFTIAGINILIGLTA
jgi:hypothetical protein